MEEAAIPSDEKERIKALCNYAILDTAPEIDFDNLTKLASYICGTPVALISLVDTNRQWFKSRVGLDAEETSRDLAFCSHAILQDEVFVIEDSFKDKRFHDNPLATGPAQVRFYAGAPLHTPSGHKIGTLCVIDNKPRSLNQDQINMLKALATQVVNQMELRQSTKNAQKAARAKSSFLSTMSHEIRTPLNGIIGCANILLDQMEDGGNKDLVKTITHCGDSLLTLINDVLDYSKLESGNMEIEKESFNLEEMINNIVELFKIQASKKSLNFTYNINRNTPKYIHGDSTRLRQVLTNLISNAIKFTEEGSVTLNIAPKFINDDDCELIFSLQDTGIGIDEKSQRRLFKSFSQASPSMAKKYGGTGLGLSICKNLTELMGGRIWVQSEEGQGSTFKFTITTKCSQVVKTKQGENQASYRTLGLEHPLKILVAEDNRINQLVIRKTLEKFSYKVDIANNGVEALRMLDSNDYDLIFMDYIMPEMDGVEATKIIKSNPYKYRDPRIVALTASSMQEDKEKCIEAGMDDFISKPLSNKQLVKVLKSCPPSTSKDNKKESA